MKELNAHLYIPYSSFHPRSALAGFISGEGRRFICLCSNPIDALEQSRLFVEQLQARGYPLSVIIPQLCKVQYRRRFEYLRLSPPQQPTSGPRVDVSTLRNRRMVPLILPFTPTTRDWRVQRTLFDLFSPLTPHLRPMVVWRNARSLQQTLGLQWPRTPSNPSESSAPRPAALCDPTWS